MAAGIYLKIAGIKQAGEGKGKYRNWIVVQSLSQGGTGTGQEGQVQQVSLTFTKYTDETSAALFAASAKGENLGTTTVAFVSAGNGTGTPYMTIRLEDTTVEGSKTVPSGGGPEEKVLETVTLGFASMSHATSPTAGSRDPKEMKRKAKWDLAVGKSKTLGSPKKK